MTTTCDRCGEVNPADIHTCTPAALLQEPVIGTKTWFDPTDGKVVTQHLHRSDVYAAQPAPVQEPDPCPGCRKGGVCRTPKCGRLKLPTDHPYRTTTPAAQQAVPQVYGWVRMNGHFNSGVFHLGRTCPPGWVGGAEPVSLIVAPEEGGAA